MPVLARFYGIVIRMYFLGSEHNPPHVHAIYGGKTQPPLTSDLAK